MSALRANSPVEEDFQKLYNDVWAEYADENPGRQPEVDLDDLYQVYGSESAPPIPPKPDKSTVANGSHIRTYRHERDVGLRS
jgi:hypothetical protein